MRKTIAVIAVLVALGALLGVRASAQGDDMGFFALKLGLG